MPSDYARIFAFDNFTRTQKHVLAKMAELDGGVKDCAQLGSYVRLYVKNVPTDIASKLCHPSRRIPVVVSGLFQHESKMSVLHFRYSSLLINTKFYLLQFSVLIAYLEWWCVLNFHVRIAYDVSLFNLFALSLCPYLVKVILLQYAS